MLRAPLPSLCAATVLALGSCRDTGPEPDPSGTYSVAYPTPGPLIYSTTNCDRYLQYAITSLGRGSFELSINVFEDCRRTGNGYASWEVLVLGRYTTVDTTLMFTPESPGTAPFPGTFDRSFIRLTVPARTDSLASTPIHIELGPKQTP
jgi:hypothetical protein